MNLLNIKNIFAIILMITIIGACDFLGSDGDDGGSGGGGGYNDVYNLSVGDIGPGGGKIFYINPNADSDGWKYLEVASANASAAIANWSTITNIEVGTATAIGAGSDNTDAIIDQNNGNASSAKLCRNYRAAQEGDWFLPSKEELNVLFNSGVGLPTGTYQTSSEDSETMRWVQLFYSGNPSDGNQYPAVKAGTYDVRAIRAF